MRVLVTGGTGMLGSHLVPRLVARGHETRVLSRHVAAPEGAAWSAVKGDVRSGEGVREAAAGCDAIIHAATSPRRRARATEVEGARPVAEAARAEGAHLVYVSIVGVDRHRFPYYRAKYAAEEVVRASGARWTIQRATQFHDLLDLFLSYPLFPVTKNMAFQPVDAGEVSERLIDLVETGPAGCASDFGGPEILSARAIAEIRERVTGKRARLMPAPRLWALRDFDDGLHLCPDFKAGTIRWEDWVRRQSGT
jgi:uncharacterized protein YbjT (DUF2867 family)